MTARDASRDRPCPACGAMSEHEPPEMVDIGVGEQQVSPDEWCCPTHGLWCVPAWQEPPVFENPVVQATSAPRGRSTSTAGVVVDLALTGAALAGKAIAGGVIVGCAFAGLAIAETVRLIAREVWRDRCQDCGAPADADRCASCDEQARGTS